VPAGQPLVLVTMGGVTWQHEGLEALAEHNEAFFVVPGASDRPDRHGSLLTLPHHSRYYHPDLVHAADLVVGKIGYSTLAETLSSGAGFLLVARPSFPESEHLIDFASSVMPTRMLTEHQLQSHSWLELIPTMAAPGDRTRREVAGAAQAARAILDLLDR